MNRSCQGQGCTVEILDGNDCSRKKFGKQYWNEDELDENPWPMTFKASKGGMGAKERTTFNNGYLKADNRHKIVVFKDSDGFFMGCGVLNDIKKESCDQPVLNDFYQSSMYND